MLPGVISFLQCIQHHVTDRLYTTCVHIAAVGAAAAAVNGEGATHLCDVVACQLPEAGWWEQGGGSRNGRSLNRSNSSRGRGRSIQDTAAVEDVAADLQVECAFE
jgi:hypothetical protein